MHCFYLRWCPLRLCGPLRCCYDGRVLPKEVVSASHCALPQPAKQSEDAFKGDTSEPLEDDYDETPTYLQGYLHRRLRISGSTSGTSVVSIRESVGTNGQSVNDIKGNVIISATADMLEEAKSGEDTKATSCTSSP